MEVFQCIAYGVIGYVVYSAVRTLIGKLTVGKFDDKYILITGCDSGFGLEACFALADMGFHVFAGCFTQDGLDHFIKHTPDSVDIMPFHLDVSSEDCIKSAGYFVREILPPGKGLWAVINNAGVVGLLGPVQMQNKQNYETCINVNLLGCIEVTRQFLTLVQKEKGRVINTSSIMGRLSFPSSSPYSISKYGVEAFSDCLRREMVPFGVSVHIIEPGFFQTALTNSSLSSSYENLFQQAPENVQQLYGESHIQQLKSRTELFLKFGRSSKTRLVVDAYIHAVASLWPHRRYIVGWDARTVYRFFWNIPTCLADQAIQIALPNPTR